MSVNKISQKYSTDQLHSGGGLHSNPGRKPFDFEKQNRPGVRGFVCMGERGSKFGPNDKEIGDFFSGYNS